MSERMPENTTTSDKQKKNKSSKKSKKKKRDPHKARGTAYRMRWADDGTIWHSEVDIDRPNSPIVEWPEFPGFEIRDDIKPTFSTSNVALLKKFGETGDIKYAVAADQEDELYEPNEVPRDEDEDNYDGVYQEEMSGLYGGDTKGDKHAIDKADVWDI